MILISVETVRQRENGVVHEVEDWEQTWQI